MGEQSCTTETETANQMEKAVSFGFVAVSGIGVFLLVSWFTVDIMSTFCDGFIV